MFGFTGDGTAGAPREIYPQTGDSFTVLEQWLDLDAQGSVVGTVHPGRGHADLPRPDVHVEELDAAAGEYLVGLIAEDLDGNRTEVYAQVTVE